VTKQTEEIASLRDEMLQKNPSGAKALADFEGFMQGLKPAPFPVWSSSAA
jgi:hypothetical protein